MPYLTPDTPPDETVCRLMVIPKDSHWLALVDGAFTELVKKYNWELFGTYTPEETSQKFLQIYSDFIMSECADMSGCCYDVVMHRVTEDGDLEISINGGDWIPDPNDPRITAVAYPPLVFDEHHTKCDAAENVAGHLNEVIDQTSDQLGGTGSLLEIASVIALAVFALFLAPESIPALVPLVLPLISAILFLGQAAFDAYFDTTVHDLILCSIFCSIGDDGTFTDTQYADLLGRLVADLPASPAKDYFVQIVGRIGLVGINDYAAIGTSADADCSDCEPCATCEAISDFHLSSYGGTTFGLDLEYGADFLEITPELYAGDGAYYITLSTDDNTLCCVPVSIEYLDNPPVADFYHIWNGCGESLAFDDRHTSIFYGNSVASFSEGWLTNPGRVRITFAP